jgi:glycerol-3-phosphate acyltransferase PlsY
MPWKDQLMAAPWGLASLILISAYALGCFATGYYLVRVMVGRDVREIGSGNVGARNVGRYLGKTGFAVTLLGDIGKGMFVVWAARHFTHDAWLISMAMIAVVAGHIWPAQLMFRGGKGIATSLGAILVYEPRLALAFILLFLVIFAILRSTTLPGLLAFALLPAVCLYDRENVPQATAISALAIFVMVAHRKNLMEEISRLLGSRNLEPKPTPPEL